MLLFIVYFLACVPAAATGALFAPGDWYAALKKPNWVPPNWLFPVVWTILYIAMAYAAARVSAQEAGSLGLAFWAVQITLNALWTPMFFGLQRMRDALVVILGLWIAVACTMLAFFQVDTVAGLLMLPYLVWVSIAGALNYSVWRLNP